MNVELPTVNNNTTESDYNELQNNDADLIGLHQDPEAMNVNQGQGHNHSQNHPVHKEVINSDYKEFSDLNANILKTNSGQSLPSAFKNSHSSDNLSVRISLPSSSIFDKKEKDSMGILSIREDFDEDPMDALSLVSTVYTADGIADPVSFRVNCLIVFLGDMSRYVKN